MLVIRSMRFLNTRLNVLGEELGALEVARFFGSHFEVSSESLDAPHATIEIRHEVTDAAPPMGSGPFNAVWIRKSHSSHFSISAKRYERGTTEVLVCDDSGTRIQYDRARRHIGICRTARTRPIELIEVIRDLVLKNEELAGTVVIHAAVVASPAGAVVIIGGKGAGKTTLAFQLVQKCGCVLLSGDKALLCVGSAPAGIRVYSWPDWPNIGLGTLQKYPRLVEELGIGQRIAKAKIADLWSVAHKIAVPPEVISRHFRTCERRGPLPIIGVCYPRVEAGQDLRVTQVEDHYSLALPHTERAFHARSDWNHFMVQDDVPRDSASRRLESLWNELPGYELVGAEDLSNVAHRLASLLNGGEARSNGVAF